MNHSEISRVDSAKREESASKKDNASDENLEKGDAAGKASVEEKSETSPVSKDKDSAPPVENYKLRRGEKEFAIDINISPFNPSNFAGPKEYDVYGRRLISTSFRFGRVIGTKSLITYEYLFEVKPFAIFLNNEVKNTEYNPASNQAKKMKQTIRETSYGIGIQPANFRFIFFPERRLRPFAQAGVGILITNKAIPVPYSRNLNFTGDFGGGIQYFMSRKRAVSFGYRYFHISNGNIGGKANNPGYNANSFYVSFSTFQR
ncbi:MAG TPA: acyloxyacyl hydrolase [Pyrinomonadaceae bacterium]|nr:acyloxyacyl hydrolase [Pyrinomonadaceae bacterium]